MLLWKNRSVRFLVYLLILLFALETTDIIPVKKQGYNRLKSYNRHYTLKANQSDHYDIVAFGDSSVSTDISPEAMVASLPGLRPYNFAFPGLSMNKTMLMATEDRLDVTSPSKAILLGFSTHTLTDAEQVNNKYYYPFKNVPFTELLTIRLTGYDLLNPTSFDYLYWLWTQKSNPTKKKKEAKEQIIPIIHDDTGWFELESDVEKTEFSREDYVNKYKDIALGISPTVVSELLEQVRIWHQKGIRVFGFRVPLAPALIDISDEVDQFNQNQFVTDFMQSGGTWIPINSKGYKTVDGFHLSGREARRLSKDIAEVIKSKL